MKSYRLEEVCLTITDGAHRSPKSVEEGYPMASVKDMTPHGLNLKSCRRISKEEYQLLVKQNCKPIVGDVLIAKDGNSALDTVCEIKKNDHVVLLSSVAILRPDPKYVTSSFLRYYLDCDTTREYLKQGFITGAAIPRVILKDFKTANIPLPPLPTQHKIAAILSAYDDLIENNNRRIAILEEMAQSIYREWFVNFRFPGHEQVKMVDSPLGKIPEGWEDVSLETMMSIKGGSQPPKKTFVYEPVADYIRLIQIRDYQSDNHLTYVPMSSKLRLCDERDILIARYGASVARICWGLNGAYNVALAKVLPVQSIYRLFLKVFLQDDFFQQKLIGMSGRAAQNGFNKGDIASIRLARPKTEDLFQTYSELIHPMESSILNLRRAINNLRQTRDLLLSKLISGKIDVSDLDIDMPAIETRLEEELAKDANVESPTPKAVTQKENVTPAKSQPATPSSSPVDLDTVETHEVMAVFRQCARELKSCSREALLKAVSLRLGYRRMGSKIKDILKGHLREAIRRKIIGAEGDQVWLETTSMEAYTKDELRATFISVMDKNKGYEREDVIRHVAQHLGYVRLTDTIKDPIKSAINGAIRMGILGYQGDLLWREM